ncbi:uncharacterized protein LOC132610672 isoform X2 [Lycium barbarum]|uniref:uncharacterized protein LOC132610672 isoform X2 n=1 Tax=Lycium barbarum TaxID=112863 RepID=UPI00293E97B7|nr:uncharacterized protein LOC132610672 isoform X2 [Lycium barbarum]
MYPRVKVRVQKEEDDEYAYESLPSLKAFESLSISDFSSSDDSPTSVVRIPRACILSPDRHGLPLSTGRTKDNSQNIFGGSKTNPRATSVPRPRAVLSSPDNDQMISTRRKTKAEVISGLKNHNACQNRHHIKCNAFPKSIQAENLTSGHKGSNKTVYGKLDSRARARLVKADPSQRTHLWKADQDSVCSK